MGNKKRVFIHTLAVFLVVFLGAGAMVFLKLSKPPLAKQKPPVSHPLVQVVEAKPQDVATRIAAEGSVTPVRETTLAAEVAGRVVEMAPQLVVGGIVQEGQILLRLDPTDYQLSVTLNEAEVKDAERGLQEAAETAKSAREEWRRLGKQGDPPPLVAKEPQLIAAQAALEAAQAQLKQARVNLERTSITAPFAGRISAKNVELGQYLAKGSQVASLFGTAAMEVVVYLEDADLAWLDVPGLTVAGDQPGSPAQVSTQLAGSERVWSGQVVRSQAKVDESTRLVPVVVEVDKPFATLPPLAPGLYVRVELAGRVVSQASLLPRGALRQDSQVWLVQDGRLAFQPVKVLLNQGDQVVVQPALPQGSQVVLTRLQAATQGMQVRASQAGATATPEPATTEADREENGQKKDGQS